MDEITPEPVVKSAPGVPAVDIRQLELAQVVGILENGLERIEALGLSLVAALLDHAVAVAKLHMDE
jgi:hypothetical protein